VHNYVIEQVKKIEQWEIENVPEEVFLDFTLNSTAPEVIINLKRNETLALKRKKLANADKV
jgi:hypothetical protein